MNKEEEMLKGFFKDTLSQEEKHTPEFDSLWPRAGWPGFFSVKTSWKIAASMAIVCTLSTLVYINHAVREKSIAEISSWQESTGGLMPTGNSTSPESLSEWTSPTSSLLSTSEQNIK